MDTETTVVDDTPATPSAFIEGTVKALEKRKLTAETCKIWDYVCGTHHGKPVQIANYKDAQGRIIAQKIRYPNKEFVFKGDTKNVGLYGQHLWRDGGKMLVVTEGEIDALSVSQCQNNKYPVVSVPNGAQGAKKAIQKNLEWLQKFDTVVFMFDNDEHGKKAAAECAELLPVGRAKIASLPLKDASDMLQAGKMADVINAIWGAKTFRPDGVIAGTDLWDVVSKDDEVDCWNYPYQGLNEKTRGIRKGELVTITAGSGMGKSQVCREIAYHLIQQGQKVGYIGLEESVKRSMRGLMSVHASRPLHLRDVFAATDPEVVKSAYNAVAPHCCFYDHFGSMDADNLLSKIRYMARGEECGFIVLDHISILISGMEDGDERRLIDNAMTKLRQLVEELKIGLILVSHLKRPAGDKGHEDGAQTSLAQLRGSAAIGQLSDMVLGFERNQQGENPNLSQVRVLKNRYTGETGVACRLSYSPETSRLIEADFADDKPATPAIDNEDF